MDIKLLEIKEWETPASRYEAAQVGNHRLAKHLYYPGLYAYHGIDGYTVFSVVKPITTTVLMELRADKRNTLRWHEWMVDSPSDYRAMQKYAARSHGRVLTTGLGLGLVTHELCKNKDVDDITIVELSPAVIQLVQPYLPTDPRIHIECGDFWAFIEKDNAQWDCIIADIWVFFGLQQQLEMYRNEIIPACSKLRAKYPTADIVCHGFAGAPTVSQLDQVIADGNEQNPMVIDPLIYGLST